jgi:hypothetical protein
LTKVEPRLTRGEIYTTAARGAYTGKPRPVVILQDDRFDATASITVCPFTTNPVEAGFGTHCQGPGKETQYYAGEYPPNQAISQTWVKSTGWIWGWAEWG